MKKIMIERQGWRRVVRLNGIALMALGLISLAACNGGTGGAAKANGGGEKAQAAVEAVLDGNTLTYGEHVYALNGEVDFGTTDYKTPTASVTFTNVPADYAEFETVYNKLLGKSPAGVAAMVPMAIELYARDKGVGERCLKLLLNGQATVDEMVRVLKTKLDASQYGPENDQYLQRYMAAALLKGADNANGYTPDEPYTVELCSSPNKVKDAPLSGGTVYYLFILANGWDSFQRSVEVIQPTGSEYYKVFNCPATYSQCKTIVGTWGGLK